MKAEEQELTSINGFFSKIRRGFVGLSQEVSQEVAAPVESNLIVATVEEFNAVSPASVEGIVQPAVEEKSFEEVEELVITCEGAAGPQVRRCRGYGPTITHANSPKSQSKWLLAEAEAVAIAEPVAPPEPVAIAEAVVAPEPATVAEPAAIAELVPAAEVVPAPAPVVTAESPLQLDQTPVPVTPDTTQTTDSNLDLRTIAMANNLKESLNELMQIEGAVAVALVDGNSGMAMGTAGGGPLNLEVAAAGNSEVVRSKYKVMKALGLRENVEDILISLNSQYHLIRPLAKAPEVFIYLVLNRSNANLAMARFKLAGVEKDLAI